MDGQHGERFFWCAKHQRAERTGEVVDECLLVGPYSTKEQAEEFAGGSAFLCKLDKSACDHDWNNEGINPTHCLKCGQSFTAYAFMECP